MKFNPLIRHTPTFGARLRSAAYRTWQFIRRDCAPAVRAGFTAMAITMLRLVLGRGQSRR